MPARKRLLFQRRSLVDGLQRQGDFDEFFGLFHAQSSRVEWAKKERMGLGFRPISSRCKSRQIGGIQQWSTRIGRRNGRKMGECIFIFLPFPAWPKAPAAKS